MAEKAQTKSKSSSLFRIHVRPEAKTTEAKIGRVRNNEYIGETYPIDIEPPIQYVPNYYSALVIKDESNGKYKGVFKFAKDASEEGAVKIDIRYLSSTPSLDAKWQAENGHVPVNDEEEVGWALPQGRITDFEMKLMPSHLVDFFNHHEGNGSNPIRDIRNSILFEVIDSESKLKDKLFDLEMEEKTLKEKKLISTDSNYVNYLCYIFGVNLSYDLPTKTTVLLDLISSDNDNFYKKISLYQENIKSLIEIAVSNKQVIVDSSKDGKHIIKVGSFSIEIDARPEDKGLVGVIKSLIKSAKSDENTMDKLEKLLKIIQ